MSGGEANLIALKVVPPPTTVPRGPIVPLPLPNVLPGNASNEGTIYRVAPDSTNHCEPLIVSVTWVEPLKSATPPAATYTPALLQKLVPVLEVIARLTALMVLPELPA